MIEARLLRRYKRFLADVELDSGEVITVHCPNTGAMTGCAPPGARVWLSTSAVKTRKYPNTWELVETPSGMACIHSARANKVVCKAFEEGLIPGFEAYPSIRSEVKYGDNSRVDLLLEGDGGRVFVEVKSVTLSDPRYGHCGGAFPDAVSKRGTKHLRELQNVLDNGRPHTRSLMLYCVLHEGIQSVCVAGDIDPLYRRAMQDALAAGVEVLAWGAVISPQGVELSQPLPFTVDPPG